MRIIESDGFTALCERRGERRRVNVMLLEEAPAGACVLVHVNNAVRFLGEEEAQLIDEALDELAVALDNQAGAHSRGGLEAAPRLPFANPGAPE
jgi:hydrogenase expression/formation protein HypC